MDTVDTQESSAAGANYEEVQDHPHACLDGWVYLTFTAIDEETGEEVERVEALPCRRSALRRERMDKVATIARRVEDGEVDLMDLGVLHAAFGVGYIALPTDFGLGGVAVGAALDMLDVLAAR